MLPSSSLAGAPAINSRSTATTPSPSDSSPSQSSISSELVLVVNGERATSSAGSKPGDASKLLAEIEWLNKEASDARAKSDLWRHLNDQITSYFCDPSEVLVLARKLDLDIPVGMWPTEDLCRVKIHDLTQYALKREEQIENIKAAHPELDLASANASTRYDYASSDPSDDAEERMMHLDRRRAELTAPATFDMLNSLSTHRKF